MLAKVITGNPGVGKHTVAKMVAKKLDLELIDINKIAINARVFEKKNDALDVDVKMLQKILAKQLTKNSLIVGHLAPYVLSKKQVEIIAVLRKNPYSLGSIYKKRIYSPDKAIENLGSEILGITFYDTINKFGMKKTFQIDTTRKSIHAIAKKIESLFVRRKIKNANIDWLHLVLKNNDLKRFFPY